MTTTSADALNSQTPLSESVQSFSQALQFLELITKLSGESKNVVARCYQEGLWCQFSGRDFANHVSQSATAWLQCAASKENGKHFKSGSSLLLFANTTYGNFVSLLGALLSGIHVVLLPESVGDSVLKWAHSEFKIAAIATDKQKDFPALPNVPVLDLSVGGWFSEIVDGGEECFPLQWFRLFQAPEEVQQMKMNASESLKQYWNSQLKFWEKRQIGQLSLVSYGSDGFQKPETLTLNEFQTTAQNFISSFSFSEKEAWKTMELLPLSHPFALSGFFATLWRSGVLGFLNPHASWETNFRILRPTILFAGARELQVVHEHAEEMAALPSFKSRKKIGDLVEATRGWLEGGRALKLPEFAFDTLSHVVRHGSRYVVGKHFIREALGELKCVVHGLSSVKDEHSKLLERLGLKIVETYGVTAACGILSTNSYATPHSHVIGSPLAHVQLRLGAHSLLEYRISKGKLEGDAASKKVTLSPWLETGDIVQMTPFGYAITGRRKHLFFTQGGLVVSPSQIEKNLKQNELIAEACLVGDKMPFLSVLIELSPNGEAQRREDVTLLGNLVEEWVGKVNESLPRNATIKKFHLLAEPFQAAKGERLSNGQLNRFQILISRRTEISALYAPL